MNRFFMAAMATAVIGGAIGCDKASSPATKKTAPAASTNTVSETAGTLVSLKVPNMT